jgi:hypothetical protein
VNNFYTGIDAICLSGLRQTEGYFSSVISNLANRLLFRMEVAMLRPSIDIKKASHKSVQKRTARAFESAQNEVFVMEEERYLPGEGELVIGLNRVLVPFATSESLPSHYQSSSSWNWVGSRDCWHSLQEQRSDEICRAQGHSKSFSR